MTRTERERLDAVGRKLRFWERNLAANEAHYMAKGRPAESLDRLRGQLDIVRETLELLDEL